MNPPYERRNVSMDATRQLAMVAKLMAVELDPKIPRHAELLASLERALYQLRKDGANESKP